MMKYKGKGEAFSFRSSIWLKEYKNDYIWKIFNKTAWSGLIVQIPQYRNPSILERKYIPNSAAHDLRTIFDKKCRSLAVLDEGVIQWLEEETQIDVYAHPDFAEIFQTDSHTARGVRAQYKIPEEKLVISLLGHLQDRKGLERMIKTIKMADKTKYHFIFAGAMVSRDPDTIAYLQKAATGAFDNVTAILSRIDDQTFNGLMLISNIFWAAYNDFPNSSNIQASAALLKKPCIVSKGFLMQERSEAYNLGIELEQSAEAAQILKMLEVFFDDYEWWLKNNKCEAFVAIHSEARLSSLMEQLI